MISEPSMVEVGLATLYSCTEECPVEEVGGPAISIGICGLADALPLSSPRGGPKVSQTGLE